MMDELQSPSSNKKRKTADSGNKRRLAKEKVPGDLAGTLALQSPCRSFESFNSSPASARIPSGKNAKAGPSTKQSATSQSRDLTLTPSRVSTRASRPTFKKMSSVRKASLELPISIIPSETTKASPSTKQNPASQSRDLITSIRASSRVSRPTFKKMLFVRKSPSSESDGTPPMSIIPPAPAPSLKRKKTTSSPTKRLAGSTTPSKSKFLDPNPIELTSSDDGSRHQPPLKRVKHTNMKPLSSQVIDLCSESEDVIASRTRAESVVVLSTDEEVDLKSPSLNRLVLTETDTRKSPALSPVRDISPPPEFQALQAIPRPKASVAEDGVRGENIYVEKPNLRRGSLQALYNEALAGCALEPQRAANQPSPFYSLPCVPPARIIRYATETPSLNLHTPLFFERIILRRRAKLKQPRTSDAKAILDDTSLDSMQASKLDEEQDALIYSDAVMEISTANSEAPEAATETSIYFQGDALSDTRKPPIPLSIIANDSDVNERPVSQCPSLESSLLPAVSILEDTSFLDSIQAQKVSVNYRPPTPDKPNFATSTNTLCNTPSNPDTVNYKFETLQAYLSGAGQVATIDPIVLKDAQFFVQALQRKYDASKISEFSLHLASLNDTAKPSVALEPFFESPLESAMITNTSSAAISSCAHASSASKALVTLPDHAMMRYTPLRAISSVGDVSSTSESPETPMVLHTEQLDLSSPASLGGDASGFECLSDSPAIPPLSLVSSSTGDTPSSRNPSPSRQSPHSSASIESVGCHLLTSDESPSPVTPVEAQKQEPLVCSNSSLSPVDVSLFDIDMSELNLQTLIGCNFDEDDDDDDISVSGMELTYPEGLQTI